MREREGFEEFVAARSAALLRTGWLLTGDWFLAQDLVQDALIRCWSAWYRIARQDAPEIYVRKAMLNIYLSSRRRHWRAEVPTEAVPEQFVQHDAYAQADLRHALQRALTGLARRQRAVVVLRYFDDLTEAQVADLLGCSLGTVKSQAAKALSRLRADPRLARFLAEEATR